MLKAVNKTQGAEMKSSYLRTKAIVGIGALGMGKAGLYLALLFSLLASALGSAVIAKTPLYSAEEAEDLRHDLGLAYLERLAEPGALAKNMAYMAPSQIPEHYSHAIYVNTAGSGAGKQKMWVVERTEGAVGDPKAWKLAMWDEGYWKRRGIEDKPAYSWLVSTGRKYGARSGPTPTGIFNIDDRRHRHIPGWGSPGMYKPMYIDLHYSSGRASGVAIHGTTRSKYRKLGTIDSHGCVRLTQKNSDKLYDLLHKGKTYGEKSSLWGEVPRFFASTPKKGRQVRRGYWRDGALKADATGEMLTKQGYKVVLIFFRDDWK